MNDHDKKTRAPETGTGSDAGEGKHQHKGKARKPLIFSIMQEIIDEYPEIDDDELDEAFLEEVKNKPKRQRELVVYFRTHEADAMRPKPEKPEPTPEQQKVHEEALAARRQDYKAQLVKLTMYELTMQKFGERTGGETIAFGEQMRQDASEKGAFAELIIKLGQSVGLNEKINTLDEKKISQIGFTEEAFRKFMA